MTVTSFYFFIFLLLGVILYYMVPKCMQWVVLLIMSVIFYFFAATPYTFIYLLISTILAYGTTILISKDTFMESESRKKIAFIIIFIGIIGNIFIWFILKGSSFWILGFKVIHHFFPEFPYINSTPFVAAIGMGYYTAQIIGYIVDCYWGNIKPQKNPLKLLLFVAFFPQLTVGPISSYSDLKIIYESHKFSYQNLCFGVQRILWGVFKKLVISDRAGLLINGIWNDTTTFSGFYPWIAVFLYPIQIYTDFSGCMDIVLGAAELFDIHLAENFKNPFYARSCQEYWQRWHITLGKWAKTYVFYPTLKCNAMQKLGKWSKKHFTKRIAKLIPWSISMAILWFVMGVWHGAVQHILGVSLWFWTIMVISEFMMPVFIKMKTFFKIDEENFSWKLFQRVRTYSLYAVGAVFFSSPGLRGAIEHYKVLWNSRHHLNPWIFFDGSIVNLGVSWRDINLIILGGGCLLIVAHLRECYGYARNWMKNQLIVFRWGVWITLSLLVLVYGLYGAGYNASQFIYQGF